MLPSNRRALRNSSVSNRPNQGRTLLGPHEDHPFQLVTEGVSQIRRPFLRLAIISNRGFFFWWTTFVRSTKLLVEVQTAMDKMASAVPWPKDSWVIYVLGARINVLLQSLNVLLLYGVRVATSVQHRAAGLN